MGKNFMGMCAYTLTLLGVIFLLGDLGKWDFWGINWWTAMFLMMGLFGLMHKGDCGSCGGCCDEMPKKKK